VRAAAVAGKRLKTRGLPVPPPHLVEAHWVLVGSAGVLSNELTDSVNSLLALW
jgi:hypothetical protein